MRCPKCGFTSFPYLDNCGKCGQGLAEQRAALGVYALRPDPPDLRLAYQTVPTGGEGVDAAVLRAPVGIDLDASEEIDLELVEEDESLSAPGSGPQEPEATVDLPIAFESASAPEPHVVDPGAEPTPDHEDVSTPIFDLGEVGGIALELEDPAQLRDVSMESPQPPTAAPQVRSVYDLDLDTDTDELTLGPAVDESEPVAAPQDVIEYVLEVDDEIEVEFEVDELDLEESDEGEDDDTR